MAKPYTRAGGAKEPSPLRSDSGTVGKEGKMISAPAGATPRKDSYLYQKASDRGAPKCSAAPPVLWSVAPQMFSDYRGVSNLLLPVASVIHS